MPVPAPLMRDAGVAGPIGGLALSVVRAPSSMMVLRAARWHKDLARLGLRAMLGGLLASYTTACVAGMLV